MFGQGKTISNDRFRIQKGLKVFFYDSVSIEKEFCNYGLLEYHEIDEPVKHMENEEPMKFWMVICMKSSHLSLEMRKKEIKIDKSIIGHKLAKESELMRSESMSILKEFWESENFSRIEDNSSDENI